MGATEKFNPDEGKRLSLAESASIISKAGNSETINSTELKVDRWDRVALKDSWLTWIVTKTDWLVNKSAEKWTPVKILLDKLWTTIIALTKNLNITEKADPLDKRLIDKNILSIMNNTEDRETQNPLFWALIAE